MDPGPERHRYLLISCCRATAAASLEQRDEPGEEERELEATEDAQDQEEDHHGSSLAGPLWWHSPGEGGVGWGGARGNTESLYSKCFINQQQKYKLKMLPLPIPFAKHVSPHFQTPLAH